MSIYQVAFQPPWIFCTHPFSLTTLPKTLFIKNPPCHRPFDFTEKNAGGIPLRVENVARLHNRTRRTLESTTHYCVRIPLRAIPPSHLAATEDESAVSENLPSFAMLTHRLRRTRRGPGWNSTVPWFDRQLQVELQGFGFSEMTISVRPFLSFASARWLTSCARQSYQRSSQLSPSPGGAQTRPAEINYAVARVRFHSSKRRVASIAC